jgi:chlorobactene glucosyltransferase
VAFIISSAWLAIVAWLISRAVVQCNSFEALPHAPPPPATNADNLLVIVPARNEAANIRRCLLSLVNQTYPQERLSVVVVDDHSEDATVDLARSVAHDGSRVGVISSPPLPRGWIGKAHACWIGANAATSNVEWLCFIDADMETRPELLASAVTLARNESLSLLSLAPKQELESFAERLVMPCGFYGLAFWQDLRKLQSPRSRDATATGQFMLIRQDAYRAVDGHAAVSNVICEDVALARLIKRKGAAVSLRDGGRLFSTRMYTGWSMLWPGLTKNLVDMLGGPLPTFGAAFLAVTLAWAAVSIPLMNIYDCVQGTSSACWGLGPALAGSAATLGLHLGGALHFRIPLWCGMLFPLGYTATAALAIDSVRRRWRRRVFWKGRVYS